MRIDKYLKISRLIKRRTLAQEACDKGKVLLNDKIAKSATTVKIGDKITITLGQQVIQIEVLRLDEHVLKENAPLMYRLAE